MLTYITALSLLSVSPKEGYQGAPPSFSNLVSFDVVIGMFIYFKSWKSCIPPTPILSNFGGNTDYKFFFEKANNCLLTLTTINCVSAKLKCTLRLCDLITAVSPIVSKSTNRSVRRAGPQIIRLKSLKAEKPN